MGVNLLIRKYGNSPFKAAIIHGGPGACGSVACIAKKLSKTCGAVEPIQSKYAILDLINELHEQLKEVSTKPLTLVGHSWGAWLAVLYTANYPELVKRIVLVGSGPFKAEYVSKIMERRLYNLSDREAVLFNSLLKQLESDNTTDKNASIKQLGVLAEKADNYNTFFVEDNVESIATDGEIYASIWPQADKMRSNGELLQALNKLKCPVTVIHGEHDPHPVEGVTEPLKEQGVVFDVHILQHCGHSPFKEREAVERFYQILIDII